ncbi:hypothetical protein [Ramlibacter sp. WS9]|uniref:hypothetical protein n=1 Tax=Ramlibacter sp. WS9 TaxID=1882741 RepID=UPI001143EA77|nr:hypothetical protein [Ramlibacter sp. WS9]
MAQEFDRIEPTFNGGPIQTPSRAPIADATFDHRYRPTSVPLEVASNLRGKRQGRLAPYEKAGRVIRLMAWVTAAIFVGIGAAVGFPAFASGKYPPREFIGLAAFAVVITGALFCVAWGVFRRRTWARVAGVIYGVISLPVFPIGTMVGIYLLWILPFRWHHEA